MEEVHRQAEWRGWLREHAARFLLFARQKTRSEADAQDLVQEAVIESFQRAAANQPPPVALVFATIHRRAIDLGRRETRRAGREVASAERMPEAWFDTTIEERERAEFIQAALEKLPPLYREVITLKIWGELTFSQIAEALHIPANTAASRYRYALQDLKKQMCGSYEQLRA
jgi:RNA polymerase sigma-70 factor, ECF subfamily